MNVLNILFGNRDGFTFYACYWFKTFVVYFEIMLCVAELTKILHDILVIGSSLKQDMTLEVGTVTG